VVSITVRPKFLPNVSPRGRGAATGRSRTGFGARLIAVRLHLYVTISNVGDVAHHAREFMRIIGGQ